MALSPRAVEGTLVVPKGARFAIVASRFNGLIVEPLVQGAIDAIVRSGGDGDAVTIVRCPGAWELPQVVRRVIDRGGVDAVIALGAVIRGATPHFDYVAGEASRGLAQASSDFETPIGFGLLTCDDDAQARERAGGAHGNKGWDAALAALEMADLFDRLDAADAS